MVNIKTLMERIMRSKFFVSSKLKRKIEKDIKKRNDIEEQINNDLNEFNEQIDDETVLSTFSYIEEHGNKKQKEVLREIEERFNNSNLLIEDTLKLIDWYEKMCEYNIYS